MNPILAISIGIGVDGATSEQILAGRLHLVPDLLELRNECLVVFFGTAGATFCTLPVLQPCGLGHGNDVIHLSDLKVFA